MNSINEVWEQLSKKYNSRIALKDEENGYSITFTELNVNINKVVTILKKFDIKKQDKVLLFLSPHPLWHVIFQGIIRNNSIAIPCEPLSNFNDIFYILEETESKVLFTDNLFFIKCLSTEPCMQNKKFTIFYIGKDNIQELNYPNIKIYDFIDILEDTQNIDYVNDLANNSDDIAFVLYSSGTTGNLKGAVYTYSKLMLNYYYDNIFLKKDYYEKTITIFSASHIFSLAYELHSLYNGNTIIYTKYAKYLETIKKYKPDTLVFVPSVLRIIKDDYMEILNTKKPVFKFFHNLFFKISLLYLNIEQKFVSKFLFPVFYLFNTFLFQHCYNRILKEILKPSVRIVTFGTITPKETEKFFSVLGIKLKSSYGCTEHFSYITYDKHINPNLEIIICDMKTGKRLGYNKVGVIKLKSVALFKGYYKNEEKTKEMFDKNGYYIMGDIGYLTKDKKLFIEGRIKDIIVLDNGEKVNSSIVENVCKKSNFIYQIVIAGRNKPYLTALVVLNKEYTTNFINEKKLDISKKSDLDLLKKEILMDINNLIGEEKHFKWIQEVRNIAIIDEEFTIENGLVNRKNIIRREKVYDKYKKIIESLYKEEQ